MQPTTPLLRDVIQALSKTYVNTNQRPAPPKTLNQQLKLRRPSKKLMEERAEVSGLFNTIRQARQNMSDDLVQQLGLVRLKDDTVTKKVKLKY